MLISIFSEQPLLEGFSKSHYTRFTMLEKPPIPDQLIVDCLRSRYGLAVATLKFLPLGADMNAAVYKAQTDEKSYFIKLIRDHSVGLDVIQFLAHLGIQQIIPPIKTVDGHLTHQIEDFTLFVSPFINGVNGFNHPLSDSQWIKLGQALRHVHDVDVPLSLQNQIRREDYSPKWRQAVRSFYSHTPVGDDITMKFAAFMQEYMPVIKRLVDQAEVLSEKAQMLAPKFVLCHSDIHAGNVLLEGADALYIVDWDNPIMAPKERDLMFIGGGVANVWNKSHEEMLFYKGYGQTEVNSTILAYYRYERIVVDIAEFGQALLLKTSGGTDRPEMYKQFVGMFAPRGVVDIAFETY